MNSTSHSLDNAVVRINEITCSLTHRKHSINSFVTISSFIKGGGCTQECPVPSSSAVHFYATSGGGAIPGSGTNPTPCSADRVSLSGRMDLELGLKERSGRELGKQEMKTGNVLSIGTMEAKNQKCFVEN